MAYTVTVGALLGSGKTGLASTLRAQLVDTAGTNVGSAQSGFIERGASGSYMVTLTVPDGHQGGCDVYATGAPGTILAFAAINPSEVENADAKVSSRAAAGAAMTLTAGERDAVAAALLDLAAGVESGLTVRQFARLAAAVLFGKSSGGGGTFRDTNDTKNRVVAAMSGGSRTSVTRDAT